MEVLTHRGLSTMVYQVHLEVPWLLDIPWQPSHGNRLGYPVGPFRSTLRQTADVLSPLGEQALYTRPTDLGQLSLDLRRQT